MPIAQYFRPNEGLPQRHVSPYEDMFSNILRGFKGVQEMKNMPGQYERQAEQEKLANALKGIELENAPEQAKADILYKNTMSRYLGMTPEMKMLSMLHPEGSEQYNEGLGKAFQSYITPSQNAKTKIEKYDEINNALQQEVAENGPESERAQDLQDMLNKESASGSTGIQRTRQQRMQTADIGRKLFDTLPKKWLGTGSNAEAIKARTDYNKIKDPEKKIESMKDLAVFTAMAKFAPEQATNQLLSLGQNMSKYGLEEQKKALTRGWPESSYKLAGNQPPDVQELGDIAHNLLITKVKNAENEMIKSKYRANPEDLMQKYSLESLGDEAYEVYKKKQEKKKNREPIYESTEQQFSKQLKENSGGMVQVEKLGSDGNWKIYNIPKNKVKEALSNDTTARILE